MKIGKWRAYLRYVRSVRFIEALCVFGRRYVPREFFPIKKHRGNPWRRLSTGNDGAYFYFSSLVGIAVRFWRNKRTFFIKSWRSVGKIFCPIGRKKSNVKVNLDLWETQHTHVIMLIMTMHNFQFFISPLEMGKKEIFITAVCNMSFMLLRNAIRLPGSGPKGLEEEQIFWFGHPWQAVPFPACSLPVPGQSVKIEQK